MLIEFKCPHCQTVLHDPSDFAGKKSKCPRCKKVIVVPKQSKAVSRKGRSFEKRRKEVPIGQ